MNPNQTSKGKRNPPNHFIKYSGLAFQLLITITVFIGLGYFVDSKLSLNFPAFTIGFALVAFLGIFYKLFQEVKKNQ